MSQSLDNGGSATRLNRLGARTAVGKELIALD